jgi:hypothetical protein
VFAQCSPSVRSGRPAPKESRRLADTNKKSDNQKNLATKKILQPRFFHPFMPFSLPLCTYFTHGLVPPLVRRKRYIDIDAKVIKDMLKAGIGFSKRTHSFKKIYAPLVKRRCTPHEQRVGLWCIGWCHQVTLVVIKKNENTSFCTAAIRSLSFSISFAIFWFGAF